MPRTAWTSPKALVTPESETAGTLVVASVLESWVVVMAPAWRRRVGCPSPERHDVGMTNVSDPCTGGDSRPVIHRRGRRTSQRGARARMLVVDRRAVNELQPRRCGLATATSGVGRHGQRDQAQAARREIGPFHPGVYVSTRARLPGRSRHGRPFSLRAGSPGGARQRYVPRSSAVTARPTPPIRGYVDSARTVRRRQASPWSGWGTGNRGFNRVTPAPAARAPLSAGGGGRAKTPPWPGCRRRRAARGEPPLGDWPLRWRCRRLKHRRLLLEILRDVDAGAYSVVERHCHDASNDLTAWPTGKQTAPRPPGKGPAFRDIDYVELATVVDDGRIGHEEASEAAGQTWTVVSSDRLWWRPAS